MTSVPTKLPSTIVAPLLKDPTPPPVGIVLLLAFVLIVTEETFFDAFPSMWVTPVTIAKTPLSVAPALVEVLHITASPTTKENISWALWLVFDVSSVAGVVDVITFIVISTWTFNEAAFVVPPPDIVAVYADDIRFA